MIHNAYDLFELDNSSAERLANSAGLSNEYEGGSLIENLGYTEKIIELCKKAMVSDRMLRLYNHKTPTKNTVMALALATMKNYSEIDNILHKYGYCLSDSIIADIVVKWNVSNHNIKYRSIILLDEINDTLDKMGLPLLMTRI